MEQIRDTFKDSKLLVFLTIMYITQPAYWELSRYLDGPMPTQCNKKLYSQLRF